MLPSTISKQGPHNVHDAGVYIGLGSNLGFNTTSPRQLLMQAILTLKENGDIIDAVSSFWVSDAWPPGSAAPNFVNAVCRIQPFDESPIELLKRLHAIEAKFGRQRDQHSRWSARTLDLDLLDYNAKIIENCCFLVLPHRRIAERDFVLHPLLELSPNWVHPITGIAGQESLTKLQESGQTNGCHRDVTTI
jgi:2-amino-4-hydroxy-6-hydroxymethyldihydropteridine diphosphokinase